MFDGPGGAVSWTRIEVSPMACSPAQLASNRLNALKSTGPTTVLGKCRSRSNSLKHGLTGAGIVLHAEDAVEVERRFEALEREMAPRTEVGFEMVKRVALMTVKLDRSAEHEAKAISYKMRQAVKEFDDARMAEVEKAYSWIANEPATHARRLRNSPEGIDRLLLAFQGLRSDLARPDGMLWNWSHCEHLHHLMGRRAVEVPVSRAKALSDAIIAGDFRHLSSADGAGLEKQGRQLWALHELVYLIDAEIVKLEELRGKLDLEGLELDRSEAPYRAMFDDSKEAILARKYESANERSLYRALREFREAEGNIQVVAEPQVGPELASFSRTSPAAEIEEVNADPTEPEVAEPEVEEVVEVPERVDFDDPASSDERLSPVEAGRRRR